MILFSQVRFEYWMDSSVHSILHDVGSLPIIGVPKIKRSV